MSNETDNQETPSEAAKVLLSMENTAHNAIAKILAFKKQIIFATAAVVCVALLYAIVGHFQEEAENKAWNRIFAADFSARQQGKREALSDELQKSAADINAAKARFYAYMRELAQYGISNDKKDLEKAAAAAERFTTEFPSHPFINQVRLDYAAVLANLGDYAKAEKQYSAVIASGSREQKLSARLFTALNQERMGQNEAALDNFARLASEHSEMTAVATFARLRIEEKTKKAARPAEKPAAKSAAPAAKAVSAAPAPAATATPATAPAAPVAK